MNFLGKLFIILNFILAIGFVVISGTLFTQREDDKANLRQEIEKRNLFIDKMQAKVYRDPAQTEQLKTGSLGELQSVLDTVSSDFKTTRESTESTVNSLKTQIGLVKDQLAAAQNDAMEEKAKREAAEDVAKEASNQQKKLIASIQNLQDKLDIAIGSADTAKSELADVKKEMESLYLKYLDSVTRAAQFETDAKALESDVDLLQSRIETFEKIIEYIGKYDPDLLGRAEKQKEDETSSGDIIRGRVLAVKSEFDFVIINKGGPDGVKPGAQFIVYRDANYVGRIEVDKVIGTYSSAKITTKRLEILQGDKIANRLEK